jgi:hypothetical protein
MKAKDLDKKFGLNTKKQGRKLPLIAVLTTVRTMQN